MAKKQFKLEYAIKSSQKILFNRLSTPSGLSEWFADNVNLDPNPNMLVFIWDNYPSKAEIISKKEPVYIKFKWDEDEDDDSYFEFRISVNELSGELALNITDFAEDDEIEDSMQLWNRQIEELKRILGS